MALKLEAQFHFLSNETFSLLDMDVYDGEDQDFFRRLFADCPLMNTSAVISYVAGYVGIAGSVLVIWYERSGRAGPYRTLVNRLVSSQLDQMIIFYVIPTGLDILRALHGPLPLTFCKVDQYFKNHIHIASSMLFVAISGTKYAFVCIYKSIPSMDDRFIATFISSAVHLIGAVCTGAMFMLPGRPPMNQLVCTGTFYDQWLDEPAPMPIPFFISIGCVLCHLFFVTKTILQSRKTTIIVPFNHQNSDTTNLGSKLISSTMSALVVMYMVVFFLYSQTDPRDLNEFPNNIWFYIYQGFYPPTMVVVLSIMFLVKNAAYRSEIKQLLGF